MRRSTAEFIWVAGALLAIVLAVAGTYHVRAPVDGRRAVTSGVPSEAHDPMEWATSRDESGPGADSAWDAERPRPTRGTLRGVVRSAESGQPVAGATVCALGDRPDGSGTAVVAQATSGSDGRFTIDAVTPGNLVAAASGYAPTWTSVSRLADEQTLLMLRGGTVTGKVLRLPDGAPAANVTVHAVSLPASLGLVPPTATTGADGSFRIEHVMPFPTMVFVAEGPWVSSERQSRAAPVKTSPEEGRESSVTLFVAAAARIEGMVVGPDGRPVAGARAWVRDAFAWMLHGTLGRREATTDAEGRFAMDVAPGGRIEVAAVAAGFPIARAMTGELEPGATASVAVRLLEGCALEVHVVDAETLNAVAGARMSCALRAGGGVVTDPETVVTDTDGRARFDAVPRAPLRVSVVADGHIGADDVAVAAPQDQREPVVVRLVRSLTIDGTVVLADGTPAQGCRVRWSRADAAGGQEWTGRAFAGRRDVHVGPDGRFRADDVEPGRCRVVVLPPGRDLDEPELASIDVDAGATGVRIVLPSTTRSPKSHGTLLRVLDPNGEIVTAYSYAIEERTQFSSRTQSGTTIGDPVWIPADDAASDISVEIRRAVGGLGHVRVTLPSPRPATLEVRVPRSVEISGRVLGADGKGVGGLTVFARSPRPPRAWSHGTQSGVAEARTGADGSFTLAGLGPSEYEIHVREEDEFVTPDVVLATGGGSPVAVRIAAAIRPRITVLGEDRRPVVGASVAATIAGRSKGATTDDDGVVRLPSLDPERVYSIVVTPPKGAATHFGTSINAWTPGDCEFVLERAFEVRGVVRTEDGHPVPQAAVWHRKSGSATAWSGIECDADGRFRIGGLYARESVDLRASATSILTVSSPEKDPYGGGATGVLGGTDDVVLTLATGAYLRVRLEGGDDLGDDDVLFDGLDVRYAPARGGPSHGIRDGRTVFLGHLDRTKSYTVLVGPSPKGRCALVRDVLPDGREVVVRLGACEPIAGRVEVGAASGGSAAFAESRFETAVVRASLDGAELASAPCAKDGSFRFAGLPRGTWRLTVTRPGAPSVVLGAADAEPGATDVTIRLAPPPK